LVRISIGGCGATCRDTPSKSSLSEAGNPLRGQLRKFFEECFVAAFAAFEVKACFALHARLQFFGNAFP